MKKTLASLGVLLIMSSVVFATSKDDPSAAANMAIIKNGSVVKVFYKPGKPGVAKISITNSDGTEVFAESVKTKNGFTRPYNVAGLSAGDYTFKISDENGSRTTRFSTGATGEKKELVYKVTAMKKDPSRYVLIIPANGIENVKVSIYDEKSNLLYRGSEQLSGDFARVYHLKDVKGKVSFEILPE